MNTLLQSHVGQGCHLSNWTPASPLRRSLPPALHPALLHTVLDADAIAIHTVLHTVARLADGVAIESVVLHDVVLLGSVLHLMR